MKIIKNEKLIKRNSTISNYLNIIAMVMIGIAIYLTFTNRTNFQLVLYAYIPLILGFILMQIGTYMAVRYGRSPRPDEKLDAGLKGLPGDYTMYHYTTPASHLLVGPAGVWILFPYHQRGEVTFRKNRWRISGGGVMQSYMRVFGQEGLGRPDVDIENETEKLQQYLAKQMDESQIPAIKPLLVFTSEEVQLNVDQAPVTAMKLKQIKEFFRQRAKEKSLAKQQLDAVKAALPE